jgi:hypothetical protein
VNTVHHNSVVRSCVEILSKIPQRGMTTGADYQPQETLKVFPTNQLEGLQTGAA